jgi:hypothetical protein
MHAVALCNSKHKMAQHVLSMKGKDSYMSLNVRIFQYHDVPSWFHFAWKDVHAVGHVICTCHDILHILCDFLEELFTENTVM